MRIQWAPSAEWGEDMTSTSGVVHHEIRGMDGITYAVNVGNTVIYVHESRVTGAQNIETTSTWPRMTRWWIEAL